MRFSTVAFTLFGAAASASASSLFARQDTLPACAIPCTTSADLGGCTVTDTKCLCTNDAFVSSTTKCVQAACTGDDLAAALKFSQDLCLKVGVTLTAAPTDSSAASGSATTAAASTTATTPATTTAASTSASSKPSSAASAHGVNAVLGLAAAGIVALSL
ncbi:hypothetical protein M413DRAFT_445285 [Hebeloma cylindrosporum]|uniref:CFEM domain-containing protein n=1 Tax=Hebeloma cylindrosporum TaxID=76867 RepID=A0A0C2XUC4_HEBCY|nr:hypothetical protein M413DRAFT_445285 [Hebeloma cylindrosporum h7]